MPTVAGVTLAKINGIYELDVTNSSWDVARAIANHVTGAGNKQALGVPLPKGSFDECISKSGATQWMNLTDFRVDIYAQESINSGSPVIIFSASGCNWQDISGATDLAGAKTTRKVSWQGTVVNQV